MRRNSLVFSENKCEFLGFSRNEHTRLNYLQYKKLISSAHVFIIWCIIRVEQGISEFLPLNVHNKPVFAMLSGIMIKKLSFWISSILRKQKLISDFIFYVKMKPSCWITSPIPGLKGDTN